MKKIIKNSIKILLIALLICSTYNMQILAIGEAKEIEVEIAVRVLDKDDSPISDVEILCTDGGMALEAKTDDEGFAKVGNIKLISNDGEYFVGNAFNIRFFKLTASNMFMLNGSALCFVGKIDALANVDGLLDIHGSGIVEAHEGREHIKIDEKWISTYLDDTDEGEMKQGVLFTVRVDKLREAMAALDVSLGIKNVEGIGNTVGVISNAKSANASIGVNDMVEHFKTNGITINEIKNLAGNSVDLTSTQLIGTGTVLTSSTGENYTAIVYGDATGDGQVDAADISVVINKFLGEDTNISPVANVAADVQQDGELNAADISLMINSFLGNLNGDILVKNETEPEDKTGKKLSEVVKVGDYINYPVNYTNVPTARGNMAYDLAKPTDTGWRVYSNKNGIVKLIPAGCPENVSANQISAYVNNSSNFNKYLVASFASSVSGCPDAGDEADAIYNRELSWFGPIDSSTRVTGYCFWKRYEGNKIGVSSDQFGNICTNLYFSGEEYNSFGVMPVVTLKSDLINHGGDGTKANPYKLSE